MFDGRYPVVDFHKFYLDVIEAGLILVVSVLNSLFSFVCQSDLELHFI